MQSALNAVFEYCNNWSLKVNTEKTKVVIFSRGKVRRYKEFRFGNKIIDIIYDYVYLGTSFNYNGTFHKAMSKQVLQAKRATFALLRKIGNLNLPYDISLDLYEKLVIPTMLYGCEIWGYENPKQLHILYNNFIRRILKLNKSTSTCMLYGELGAKTIYEYIDNRMINFWFRLATGDENKISTILYKMIKVMYDRGTYVSPWLDKVKQLLDRNGMSYLFNDAHTVNNVWLREAFKLRISDANKQNWQEEVNSNSVCLNYRIMTTQKEVQYYLLKLPKQYSQSLCKYKCGNHKLPIVVGRYNNVLIDDRKCELCHQNDIGDEFHYLFMCPFLHETRKRFIKKYYYVNPSAFKMTQLFTCMNYSIMLNLAKFIQIILEHFKNV